MLHMYRPWAASIMDYHIYTVNIVHEILHTYMQYMYNVIIGEKEYMYSIYTVRTLLRLLHTVQVCYAVHDGSGVLHRSGRGRDTGRCLGLP